MQNSGSLRAALFVAAIIVGVESPAHAFAPFDLYNFGSQTGDVLNPQPYGTIAVGLGGRFFGAAPSGGSNSDGGIFEITPSGAETVRYNFSLSDSPTCQPGLNAAGAQFYGTCYGPGAAVGGAIYQAFPYHVIHTFPAFTGDGLSPDGPPIQIGSKIYGTTAYGGTFGFGTIYAYPGYIVLYNFTGGADGAHPAASLLQEIYGAGCTATSVCLVGSAEGGGGSGCGTVFQFTPASLTPFALLHTFTCGPGGSNPVSALIQPVPNGSFYGTTDTGGTHNDGTVFSLAPNTAFNVIYNFSGLLDGANPQSTLVAYQNNLYGTCINGGRPGGWYGRGQGTIFGMTPTGTLNDLYRFNGSVGSNPAGGLVLSRNIAYGDTIMGGTSNDGVFYGTKLP